ncbi:MAG: site-specific integrase [Planctomycetes bacterium]|nr:site-specific integrase [Planctomycetota bacterium]
MVSRQKTRRTRFRVGRVSVYFHHTSWWIYHREGGRQVRRKVGNSREDAEQVAAQINGQLAAGAPTLLSFEPIGIPELRQQFLQYHEHVLKSSIATVTRYRAATQHLENFAAGASRRCHAHEVKVDALATYLRTIKVSPNGHSHSAKRALRDKGVQFILETCRSMFGFAAKRRHLPPYAGNPFAELPLDRLKIEDAKPIFVFDADTELAFFQKADAWAFPIHFTLAKTGLRVGELVHLLIEDIDLDGGWLHVRNKTELGWRIKTGTERRVPLLSEVISVLRLVIGNRVAGPVFLRERFRDGCLPELVGGRRELERACAQRERQSGGALSRNERLQIARGVWRDAGTIKADRIRITFVRVMKAIGKPEATCPKSWRHTFATLLQDANVDPLIRQITLGHKPTASTGLGMTGNYTHTRPGTQREQIENALRRWPKSLKLALTFKHGG